MGENKVAGLRTQSGVALRLPPQSKERDSNRMVNDSGHRLCHLGLR